MRRAAAASAAAATAVAHDARPSPEEEEEGRVLVRTKIVAAAATTTKTAMPSISAVLPHRPLLPRGRPRQRGKPPPRWALLRGPALPRIVAIAAAAGLALMGAAAALLWLVALGGRWPPETSRPNDASGGSGVAVADPDALFRRSVRVELPEKKQPQRGTNGQEGGAAGLAGAPPQAGAMKDHPPDEARPGAEDGVATLLPRKSLPPPLEEEMDGSHVASAASREDYYNRYTVRINSWKREDQLRLSIRHLLSCGSSSGRTSGGNEGDDPTPPLAEIQVVWCTAQGPPPEWLLQLQRESWAVAFNNATISTLPRVTVERHDVNSLNERFHVLAPLSTAAVLSVDDDVLRPCLAMDAAFLKWKKQPHRMVGFDARTIVVDEATQRLKYGYLSTTQNTNVYSLTLSRFAFVHNYYLRTYMSDVPANIRRVVDQNFNCEDIALSLWVSYQTNNLPPLLADYWAMKSMVKLESASAISATGNHKSIRDKCVHDFVHQLQLSVPRLQSRFVHYSTGGDRRPDHFWFECGADEGAVPPSLARMGNVTTRHLQKVQNKVERWKHGSIQRGLRRDLNDLLRATSHDAYQQGYLKNTDPWRAKFQNSHGHSPKEDVPSKVRPSPDEVGGVKEVGLDTE